MQRCTTTFPTEMLLHIFRKLTADAPYETIIMTNQLLLKGRVVFSSTDLHVDNFSLLRLVQFIMGLSSLSSKRRFLVLHYVDIHCIHNTESNPSFVP